MERVQFQQEQMVAELKDFVLKGLFTEVEVKQIMKKRTEFETALVRRVARKSDFLRYAAYEMDLEKLRKKRAERTKQDRLPSISDYALVRRQLHIFERAVKKFKRDVGMWTEYINVADKMGSRTLVGKITARALQLHPNVPALYILAASQELKSLSSTAARTLLQRGIRLNSESIQLWVEYVKMELGFIEGLRRRWDLLGLNTEGEEGEEGEENEDAGRREIMNGAIVKSVMRNAVKAISNIEIFKALTDLISGYPIPLGLQESLLDDLYEMLPRDEPGAIDLLAARFIPRRLSGLEFVEGLKKANEVYIHAVRERPEMWESYVGFVEYWQQQGIDGKIVQYLVDVRTAEQHGRTGGCGRRSE